MFKNGHIVTACNLDARPARKCYACGGIKIIPRVCPTLVAQKAPDANYYTFGKVAFFCKSAWQLLAKAVINEEFFADVLVDTGSALSMLSTAIYARLPDAPVIQPLACTASEVVGVGSASAQIRGYVDMPVEVAGVAVRHSLMVE